MKVIINLNCFVTLFPKKEKRKKDFQLANMYQRRA
jgi:hypothetical protein